jgi:hypothetical protein
MGLLSFFKKNPTDSAAAQTGNGLPDNLKDESSEERNPQPKPNFQSDGEAKGIEAIYAFLQADYESKGYNDALISADESYKADNIKLIKMDLQITVQRANTYYEDLLRELDFHITSRGRAGLIDLVEELKTRKEMVHEHIDKINQVKKEMETDSGMTQRILLSYQRGFMRGLSAITQTNVLNKKI